MARTFAEFLGLKRNVVALLAAIVLIGLGEEMWMRFVPKYLEVLGAGVFVIGLYDALKTFLGAAYAYPGGVLVDRFGHRRALVLFNLISIAGYALVLAVPRWSAVIAGMFLFLSWSCLSLPATFSIVATTLSANQHTMGIGVQSLVKRLPIVAGPVLGGFLIDRFGLVTGVRIGLVVTILLATTTIFFQWQIREEIEIAHADTRGFFAVFRSFPRGLRRLLLSDILIRFCERIPFAWVVIYAMNHAHAGGTETGFLTSTEMIVAMLCYIPVSHLADKYGREPFVFVTFIFFTLFPLSLLAAKTFPLLLVAFAIRGLKEFGEPARKALIIAHCNGPQRGRMVGVYYLVRDVAVTPGAFLGAWLWNRGPAWNFVGAAIFGVFGTALYFFTARTNRPETNG